MKKIKYYTRRFRKRATLANEDSFRSFVEELNGVGGLASHIVIQAREAIRKTRGTLRIIFGAGNGALDSAITIKQVRVGKVERMVYSRSV